MSRKQKTSWKDEQCADEKSVQAHGLENDSSTGSACGLKRNKKRNRKKKGSGIQGNFQQNSPNTFSANRHNYTRDKSHSQQASTSLPSSDKKEKANPDIPGFYFDKEKKRYFKILPGQNNVHSGAVTKETIKRKEREEARQSDVKQLSIDKMEHSNAKNIVNSKQRCKKTSKSVNIFSNLMRLHQGDIQNLEFSNDVLRTFQNSLRPVCHSKIFKQPEGTYERLEHMHHMYPSQKYDNQIVCLWSLRDLLVQRIQTVSIDSLEKKEMSTNLNISTTGAMIPKAFSKITGMCSAPVNSGAEMNEYILFTTMCVIGNNPSMAMLRNLNCSSSSDFRYTEFNLGNMATWCCAWNRGSLQFSIGTEKHGILLDVETRRLWELFTGKDDVLTQAFSNDSKLLFSGTKGKGMICAHDLRSNSTGWVFKLGHKAGVCSVKVSSDDRYIYAADFNSKIKKWDIRKRKVVTEYNGHKNEYSMLPIYISEEDNILYSAGQDCYTRIWDLKTGKLRRSIPPPFPASLDSIPTLHYTSKMTYKGSQPGLFMGIKDELHFYSL